MKDIGSIWNKWDLHIHSDASDGKMNCQEIIDKAKEEKLSVIALTDHHTVKNIDKIKELAKLNDIIVLSGIEFRTEYGQKSVHMIGLFPDNYNDIDLDGKFLTENILNPLGLSESMIIQKGKEADGTKDKSDEYYFKKGIFLVQVDFKTAANLIHQYGGIVIVHAGSKSNSIDEEMKHDGTSKKNVSIYDSLGPVKDELFKGGYIDICEIRNEKDGKEFYKSEFCKPSITASDAHEKSVIGLGSCWVKAEKNFNGLKQILNEPERVNFNNPEILERVESNPLKFIKQIKIKRTANATMNEIWYDNIEIELNPGLVAIIGNKGSGKSAITDIISLCANTHNDEFSFLNKYKFRSPKPYDRSKQIQAQIVWADNSCSDWITLDSSCDKTPGERGALLLLFYLFIDMDDKPLIIDQPEENLDNESVYNYLVHFIKEAKQKRQIIIVTHNPNLAVVCDADQIVEMKIDKSYRNKVSFQSGAIENSIINDRIVTILEGTYPAFNNRDCKYSIVEHKL